MPLTCFWLEPTDRVALSLRRYRNGAKCSTSTRIHDASTPIGEAAAILNEYGGLDMRPEEIPHDDPRWPRACGCGEAFTEDDCWQVFQDRIWARVDTGEEKKQRDWLKTPGAMLDAFWYHDIRAGADGRSIIVIIPDGTEWWIDGRASNCTRPDDSTHRCWLRTGEPPRLTVSKSAPGQTTCAAGAGSIVGTNGYHGFLRNGAFT